MFFYADKANKTIFRKDDKTMLKEKWNAGVEFVKNHKKEVLIGTGLVVIGGVIYIVTKKKPKGMKNFKASDTVIDMLSDGECKFMTFEKYANMNLEIPEVELGEISDLWVDKFGKNLILNDVTVADLGKVGEQFLKIDGITNETNVTAVVGLLDKAVEIAEEVTA